MRERALVLPTPAVRSVLHGLQTQWRQVIKWKPSRTGKGCNFNFSGMSLGHYHTGVPESGWVLHSRRGDGVWEQRTEILACVPAVGSRLWVRETWTAIECEKETPGAFWGPDRNLWIEDNHPKDQWMRLAYFADAYQAPYGLWNIPGTKGYYDGRWRASTAMRRADSRLNLKVTDVRIEHLCALTDADAKANGAQPLPLQQDNGTGCWWAVDSTADQRLHARTARNAFIEHWNATEGRKDGHNWRDNPWVMVLTFEREKPQ